MSDQSESTEVAVIGAGPAGAAVASYLALRGVGVKVIERSHFPRFSIGESLLPQCMDYLQECGLLQAVEGSGFQPKDGAAFHWSGRYQEIDFSDKISTGPATTWQVERAAFDQCLIASAERSGASVEFGSTVKAFDHSEGRAQLLIQRDDQSTCTLDCDMVVDASGYGRVLARLCELERDPRLDERCALFTHLVVPENSELLDRQKILICIHPEYKDVWYWLIPFPDRRYSLGVVATAATLERLGEDDTARLRMAVQQEARLAECLAGAEFQRPVQRLSGYSADVTTLHGSGFVLLGNAGEFLDPVFSSGVTIALKSATLAAPLICRQLAGETVAWQQDFEQPLRAGVKTFRAFVDSWYNGDLPDIIFSTQQSVRVRQMVSAVLAGYAWDTDNPLVRSTERRLSKLAELCRDQ